MKEVVHCVGCLTVGRCPIGWSVSKTQIAVSVNQNQNQNVNV